MGDRWYLALLVLRSSVDGDSTYESLSDLQYRLVRANDPDDAYAKAMALGSSERLACQNVDGENARRTFLGLRDLRDVTDDVIGDDTGVCSQLVCGPEELVVPKQRLTAFWSEADKECTVRGALDEMNESC